MIGHPESFKRDKNIDCIRLKLAIRDCVAR